MIKNKYIKKVSKSSISIMLMILLVVGFSGPSRAHAYTSPATVNLGAAGSYAILSETAITTTGVTAITGDIGISPAAASTITGFSPVLDSSGTFSTSSLVTGKIYAADYTSPTPSNLTTAVNNMLTAYNDAAGRPTPDSTNFNAGNLGGQTLAPGLYKFTTNVTIPTNLTLTGTATDVWIFQISGDLSIASSTSILLSGGALARNIFWQVGGPTGATLASGSVFNGNILSAKQIIMQSGATLNGRALAQTQTTLIGNTVSNPVTPGVPDLIFSGAHHVTVGSANYDILAGSLAMSPFVVGASTITITAANPGTFTLQSGNGFSLANNAGIAQVCNSLTNSLTIPAGIGPVIVTPNSSLVVCSPASGSGPLVTNSGSTYVAPTVTTTNSTPMTTPAPVTLTITPPLTMTTVVSGCTSSTGFSITTGVSCAGNPISVMNTTPIVIAGCSGTAGFSTVTGVSCAGNTGSNVAASNSYNFGTVTLQNGSTGTAVKELQRFLNDRLNLGLVLDGKLGPKTIAVIKKWQASHGLVADGLVGVKTKAKMHIEAEAH